MKKSTFWHALVVILLVVGFLALKTYRDAGEFKRIQAIGGEGCRLISGVQSSEDITIDRESGVAFISSDDRRPYLQGALGARGAVFGYRLAAPDATPVNLTPNVPFDFHPHGLCYYADTAGIRRLFVVNHRPEGHFIEMFDWDGETLQYKRSIADPLMHSPNDVAAVGPDRFYVTNDHGNRTRFGKMIEEYLQLARSYVLYYDGRGFRKVADGLAYANGIQVSADGTTVYVAATVSQAVFVYERDGDTGDLRLKTKVDLGTGVDNLELDEKGSLWVGAHPKLLTFTRYARNPQVRSPSQVLRIRWRRGGHYDVDYIYASDGSPLSGSSVATVYNRSLFIGSVFDPAFLVCSLP